MTTYLERELGDGGDLLPGATARAAALARAGARCDGVSVPVRVRRRPDGVVAFDVAAAPGASLAEVVAGGGLSLGACVTVGVGLAQALAAMHAERVAHGDVSAANVVVKGRDVTVVDTMGALLVERGTPGFVAPERTRGASPAGDVFSLGMVLRSIAHASALPVIEAWTAPLLADDPRDRPTAAHAARALARCATREPVKVPTAPVVAAMRASVVQRTVRRPADRWWHAERLALRVSPLAALAASALVAGWGLVPAMAADPAPAREPAPLPVAAVTLEGPAAAAVELTERRVTALARGDATALGALVRAGSEAAGQVPDHVDALEGLELVKATSALEASSPGRAVVKVTSELGGYSVGPTAVPAATATALLELTLTPHGWLVERILPPP